MLKLDSENWQRFYDTKYIKMEKLVPFDTAINNPHYRFTWSLDKVGDGDGRKLLDVGCNMGIMCGLASKCGFTVSGVDVSIEAINDAKDNVPEGEFKQAYADKDIPFEKESFDVVTALEILEHVRDLDGFINECMRVLKPGGMFIATTPIGKAYYVKEHVRFFDFYSLHDVFKKKAEWFKISKVFKISENDSNGRLLFGIEVKKDD